MRIERVPAVVRRRLSEGWRTSQIARRYGLPREAVRLWRWRLGVVSPQARDELAKVADPATVQRLADEGIPLRHIAQRLGAPVHRLYAACSEGAILYCPRCVASAAKADRAAQVQARREAAALRSQTVRDLLGRGRTVREAAEAVGLTPRRVRQIREAAA